LSLETEIINQSEPKEPEVKAEKQPVLPISGVFNSIFLFLSKDWSEDDRQKLILDDMESENINELLTPLIIKAAEKLGLALEEISALIGLSGLLLPRIFLYFSLRSKYRKEGDKNERQGEKEVSS